MQQPQPQQPLQPLKSLPQESSGVQGQSTVPGSDSNALIVRRLNALEAELTSLRSQLIKETTAPSSAPTAPAAPTAPPVALGEGTGVTNANTALTTNSTSIWSPWVAWYGGWVAWWWTGGGGGVGTGAGPGASSYPPLSDADYRTLTRAQTALEAFCTRHRIDPSHGSRHAGQVLNHARRAIQAVTASDREGWGEDDQLATLLAALLHDADDHKYFPRPQGSPFQSATQTSTQPSILSSIQSVILSQIQRPIPPLQSSTRSTQSSQTVKSTAPTAGPTPSSLSLSYPNARAIMVESGIPEKTLLLALRMIDLVGCATNGNTVPPHLTPHQAHYLIPRWADRLEAVGAIGVIRCYHFTLEKGQPLSSPSSPRAQSPEEVWRYATPERFAAYQARGGSSTDMISHYYDKLLHIARPPGDIVRNAYLEGAAEGTAKELVEVCVRFGRTGRVDEEYIRGLEAAATGDGE